MKKFVPDEKKNTLLGYCRFEKFYRRVTRKEEFFNLFCTFFFDEKGVFFNWELVIKSSVKFYIIFPNHHRFRLHMTENTSFLECAKRKTKITP